MSVRRLIVLRRHALRERALTVDGVKPMAASWWAHVKIAGVWR